jgi:SPP1 family phage portal protein
MNTEDFKLLLQKEPNDYIEAIKKFKTLKVDIETISKQLDPSQHDINDKTKRKDKLVKTDTDSGTETASYYDENAEYEGSYRIEPVARISVGLQKLIVKRAVSFTFGNPVQLNFSPQNDTEKTVLNAIKKILVKNKEISLNRRVGKSAFSCKEVAEIWFTVEEKKNKLYGIDSNLKLKCTVLSPLNGDVLYPTKDDYGDLIAFSREFKSLDSEGKEISNFETYTSESIYSYIKGSGESEYKLVDGYPIKNELGKIPVIYGTQDYIEWEDVQNLIDRLEKLLSNFADVIDYNGNPMIFFKGTLTGFGRKGEAGKIIEGDTNSDAKYLSWEQAPEAVRLEIETLLKLIFMITQTPEMSFESVKGMTGISGRALKMLFFDAHLKVQEKQEWVGEYLTRRINILKAYVGLMNTGLKATCDIMDIEPEITPYMIDDEETRVQVLATATGGKSILSQKTAVGQLNYTNDSEKEYEQIKEEENNANMIDFNEPTI